MGSVADALVHISHLVDRVFADVAREQGLTPQQVHLLCLVDTGAIGMKELAEALDLEKSSLTGLVDRVARRGLITRIPDDHDRRACRVTVTDEGARVSAICHREIIRRLEALADHMADADKETLAKLAAQLSDEPDAVAAPVHTGRIHTGQK